MNDAYILIVDVDSGWESDADIVWHIDEGNEAEWGGDTVTMREGH